MYFFHRRNIVSTSIVKLMNKQWFGKIFFPFCDIYILFDEKTINIQKKFYFTPVRGWVLIFYCKCRIVQIVPPNHLVLEVTLMVMSVLMVLGVEKGYSNHLNMITLHIWVQKNFTYVIDFNLKCYQYFTPVVNALKINKIHQKSIELFGNEWNGRNTCFSTKHL